MAEASVPVDLFNPGQVFACLGLVEAADALCGDAEGVFDWTGDDGVRFWLRASGASHPVGRVLAFLAEAEAYAVAPHDSPNLMAWTESWGARRGLPPKASYPFPDPPSPATLEVVLEAGDRKLVINHWGDETTRDNVKFWAGAGGYPGAALTRDALTLLRPHVLSAVEDPFNLALPQSSSFRLDFRRDYIPIDAGFSLNAHGGRIEAVGYPLVELLAAVGLTHARPKRHEKLRYRYGVIGRAHGGSTYFAPSLLRAALGASSLPFSSRRFDMQLGWPGKEGQARAITTVTEEI